MKAIDKQTSVKNSNNNLPNNSNGIPDIQLFKWIGQEIKNFLFEENTLIVVLKGEVSLRFGSLVHRIVESQIAFVKRNSFVKIKNAVSKPDRTNIEFMFIKVSCELVKDFSKSKKLPASQPDFTMPVGVFNPGPILCRCLNSIRTFIEESGKIDPWLEKIKVLELLYHLAETEQKLLMHILDIKKNYKPNITTVVEKYMTDPISLNELARLSNRSLSSFRRDFAAIYNTSPSLWIRQQRLEKAMDLLESTNLTVTDVCYSLGFESLSHFSRLFKTYFNKSPSDCRLKPVH